MKKLLYTILYPFGSVALVLGFILLSMSCKKLLPDVFSIDIKAPDQHFTLPPNPVTGNISVHSAPISINLDSAIKANSDGLYSTKDAHVHDMHLDVTNQSSLDPFEKIEVFLIHADLGETKVAFADSIANGLKYLAFKTTGANVAPYLQKSSFDLKINALLTEAIQDTTALHTRMKFKVQLKKN